MYNTADSWLVIGADGVLGSAFFSYWKQMGLPVLGTTRKAHSSHLYLDLSHDPATWLLPKRIRGAVICAGISDVLQCQNHPSETAKINITATSHLIERLWSAGGLVVYPSSNFVFDGSQAYARINLATTPTLVYGQQKVVIEDFLKQGTGATVRLGKVVAGPLKVVQAWRSAVLQNKPVSAFEDYIFSPVSIQRTLKLITRLIEQGTTGIYQMTALDEMSYADLAELWIQHHQFDSTVQRSKIRNHPDLSMLYRQHATLDDRESCQLLGDSTERCSDLVEIMVKG